MTPPEPLLRARHVSIDYAIPGGHTRAVLDASVTIYPGQTVAIVGESGSGKSTLASSFLGLLPANATLASGTIELLSRDVTAASESEWVELRGQAIGYVPQDPTTNLNPAWRVGTQVGEALRRCRLTRAARTDRVRELLSAAGLPDPERARRSYPHELSGGMAQRALIAQALACDPPLLIADEPTSALDATTAHEVLDHLCALASSKGTVLLLVTHDLALACERADHLLVMNKGRICEQGPTRQVMSGPVHPYTRRLLAALPGGRSRLAAKSKDVAISVAGASKAFAGARRGESAHVALDGVNLEVMAGQTCALVGESGSGKTTLARALLGLSPLDAGDIKIFSRSLATATKEEAREIRRDIQVVFQNPYASLDPLYTVSALIAEPLSILGIGDRRSRRARVREMLDAVGLAQSIAGRYPAQLSGGQRQRVAIARALAPSPRIVVLDEATSALDVVVQDRILALLRELQAEWGLTYLMITHDLGLVTANADTVAVMERGRIVESGPVAQVVSSPRQAMTRALIAATPRLPASQAGTAG